VTRSVAAILLVLALPLAAAAHGLDLEANLKDGRVRVEAYYDDDTPADAAAVTVEDAANVVVLGGTTDAKGVWEFAAPKPGRYVVTVNAGDGHVAKRTITIPAPAADREAATISDGPTRAAFTGPMRWVLAAAGVAVIGGLTFLAKRLARPRATAGT
jgi:nickel transport protein